MKILTAIAFTWICILANSAYADGIQTQLDNLYLEMETSTDPGFYESARRSAYTGGRYTMKSQIYNEALVGVSLPSAKGGCGGIDIYGGSFSFISADQFQELLRQVASNAKGYFFQLALDNMCPGCMKWMNELQSKMQNLNENLSNSCQLAQGLVNDAVSLTPLKNWADNDQSLALVRDGIVEDFAKTKKHIDAFPNPLKARKDADEDSFNELTGNTFYKAGKRTNLTGWFPNGDEALLEEIMSITGTVVVGDLVAGSDGAGESPQIHILSGGKITMRQLVEGAESVEVYDCSLDTVTNNCRIDSSATTTRSIVGFKQRILDTYTGPTGIITLIRNGQLNTEPTEAQKAVMARMPRAVTSKIYTLAPISPEQAVDFVNDAAGSVALEVVMHLVDNALRAARSALQSQEDSFNSLQRDQFREARETIDREYEQLLNEYGSTSELVTHYNQVLQALERPTYVPPSQDFVR